MIDAHGDLDRWKQLSTVRQTTSGVPFDLKQPPEPLADTYATVDLHRQHASHSPLERP